MGSIFVGRDGELATLRGAWETVRGGVARVVGITGDPGIGKAALVSRFLADVDATVIHVTASDIDAATPWHVFRAVVAQTPGRRLAERAATMSADAEPGLIGIELLKDLRSTKGMVLVLEEAQWADGPSLMALHYASRRLGYDQVMVILSHSPQDPQSTVPYFGRSWALLEGWQQLFDGEHGIHLPLDGLTPADLIRLAARSGHAELSPDGAARLHEATGGNPLYVTDVLRRTPIESIMSGQGPLKIPKEIAPAIAAGLASCEWDTRELVAAGAVLGQRFSVAQVRFVSGLESVAKPIEQAIEAGLLVEVPGTDGRQLTFAKKLVRDIVYHDLARRLRAELHRRCAVTTSGAASLGHRVAAIEGGVDEILAGELATAAKERLAVSDVAGAAFYLRGAMDCTAPGPERLGLVLTAVETLLVAGELTAAQEYEGELERAPAGPWRDYALGYLKLLSGRVAAAKELQHGALAALARDGAELADAPADLRARIAAQLAIIGVVFLAYDEMVEFGTVAVAAGSPDPTVDGFAWFARTLGMALSGQSNEALELLAWAGEPGDRAAMERLVARGMIRLWIDDLDGAADDLHEVVRRATAGDALRVSQGLGFLGEVEYRRGRLGEARVFTRLAVGNAVFHSRVWDFPILHALAVYPRAAAGDWEAAERHAAESARIADFIGTHTAHAYAAGARCAIAQARGDRERLLSAAERLEAHYDSQEPGTHLFGPIRADALSQLGRLDEAETALAAFREGPASGGRRSAQLSVARVSAQIALGRKKHDVALRECASAAELAADLGLPLEEARIGLLVARCHHEQGHRTAAGRALHTARAQFIRIGADAYRILVEREAERLGIVIATSSPLEALTLKEREVARLIAEGMSYREVAARLHRSIKTVETHMSNILRKLEVADRHELRKFFDGDA
ncbi:ATP-binding protein [Actinophytocola oryzae]|uniref:ATP-binding protein n=1 Tax=Actinophytocola oryzae TaxID=502181 RepID=UPI0014150BA0|nr:LuxR family transcriptional regulator [Actinophytocola oryzae]